MGLSERLAKYPFINFRRRPKNDGSDSGSGASDSESDNISLSSDTSAASVIKGHIGETPVLSETDEKLLESLLHLDYMIRTYETMDHPPGSTVPPQVIQKLMEAGDLIQKEREQEVKVETASKYQRLYNKAERQQAEIEWKIREIEESQKRNGSHDDHVEGIRQLLIQEYLDKVEERNTIVRLVDYLENMDEEKLSGTDQIAEYKRSARG